MGIGAEVVVKALSEPTGPRGSARFVVLGSGAALRSAAKSAGISVFWDEVGASDWSGVRGVSLVDSGCGEGLLASASNPARATGEGGRLSFEWVDAGVRACLEGRAAALVTGPINKGAWAMGGHGEFPGHTELLAARCGGGAASRMMFEAPNLRTILVTTHQSLASVPAALTVERVLTTIVLGHESCVRLGVTRPRIAVCGLNPHASEGGLFGDEEARVITPAIGAARGRGIDATGPWAGDTVFGAAVKGKFDLVVAMYHDQGLIPVKLLAFDRAVNFTVGLPIVRTSPDHGTAYDIAGRNLGDPGSMIAAIGLAVRLVGK